MSVLPMKSKTEFTPERNRLQVHFLNEAFTAAVFDAVCSREAFVRKYRDHDLIICREDHDVGSEEGRLALANRRARTVRH